MSICKACGGTRLSWVGEPCLKCAWTVKAVIKTRYIKVAYSFKQRANVILAKLLPSIWCPSCQRFRMTIERRRQNTMYNDDESNHITCCIECFGRTQAYWNDQWDEYRRSVL